MNSELILNPPQEFQEHDERGDPQQRHDDVHFDVRPSAAWRIVLPPFWFPEESQHSVSRRDPLIHHPSVLPNPFGVFLGIFLREIRCDSLSVALGYVVTCPSASRAAPLATGLRLGFGLLRVLLLEVLPNHRGCCLIVALATDENDVSLIRNQIILAGLLRVALADDMVRVESPIFAADPAPAASSRHALRSPIRPFKPAAYVQPYVKVMSYDGLRADAAFPYPGRPRTQGVSL